MVHGETYEEFVDKFKPKKTTDDCFTPSDVYEEVAAYVTERFGVDRADMVRPFWPGADYKALDYPQGCVVVDNPPFSMLMEIKRFYLERGIRFFLFAPALTLFSCRETERVTHIACDANIVYENGAVVRTGFVTNMAGDIVAESDPELCRRLNDANERAHARRKKPAQQAHDYPDEIITAARLSYLAHHGQRLVVRRGDCEFVRRLDAQKDAGKSSIFGGGLLLSRRAAQERAALERAALEKKSKNVWKLSDRERALVDAMGADGSEE